MTVPQIWEIVNRKVILSLQLVGEGFVDEAAGDGKGCDSPLRQGELGALTGGIFLGLEGLDRLPQLVERERQRLTALESQVEKKG